MDLTSVDIIPKEIHFSAMSRNGAFPADFTLSFFRRLEQLGHLERFEFGLCRAVPIEVMRAFLHVLTASSNLRYLGMNQNSYEFQDYTKDLFDILEDHVGIRIFKMNWYPDHLDPEVSWLKHLLRRNRSIQVIATSPAIVKAQHEIDAIYALNRVICGSRSLMGDARRLPLMGAALTESAYGNFQRTGLLLANHTDVLCDQLQGSASRTGVA